MDDIVEEFENMIDPNNDGIVSEEEAKEFIDKVFDRIINHKEELKLYYQMSFQPQVGEYLQNRYNLNNRERSRIKLIYEYFSKKLKFLSTQSAYFTVMSFLKGFIIVYIYTDMFSDEFMLQYKDELKKILFK
jgi:hypothetical protein